MPSNHEIRFAVVIPAYKPSTGLIDVVEAVGAAGAPAIIVVDDGSGPECADIFARIAQLPRVHLLRHAVNLGKGAALKTAFNYVLCHFPGAGVVTADADGQHHPEDIARVAAALEAQPEALVLGSRSFGGEVPLRSRFGNVLTRSIMHGLLGRKLTDTQTGLRGIPAALMASMMRVEANGYEFELEMLIAAHQNEVPIFEQPIRTIYEAGNPSSHFNPITDSMKIYFVLLRFSSVAVLSALLDNVLFYIIWSRSGHLLAAQALARVVAVAFNYTMVRSSVFGSQQKHKAVLPKYLSLVLISGSVSYFAIRHLHDQFGVHTMVAKLSVETVLFFLNFAVQRLFIFKPRERAEVREEPEEAPAITQAPSQSPITSPSASPAWLPAAIFGAVLAILVAVEIYGIFSADLFKQQIWLPVGLRRYLRFFGVYLAVAVPILTMFPWTFAAFITTLLVVLTAAAVGPMPVVAVAFFLTSACALGSLILGRARQDTLTGHLLATLAGIAIYLSVMTPLARIPIHYPATWAVILAAPLIADRRGVVERFRSWWRALASAELDSGWTRAALAALVFLIMAQWVVALKPEIGTDALAVHLAVPIDIAAHHALTVQPSHLIWAVMPMGADWCFSIVYLFGGEYATRLLNLAFLLITIGLLYATARRWLGPAGALLVAAAFASTPTVQLVTGSLFVENLVAALVLGMLTAVWTFGETGARPYFYLTMLIGGAAMATKLGSAAFVIMALPFVLYEISCNPKALAPRPRWHAIVGVALLLACALPPFVIAWAKTGNPVFPYQNLKFASPLLPRTLDLNDERFHIPVGAGTIYTLTFHTADAYEGQNGSFGFQYFVLVPLALMGLVMLRRSRRAAAGALLVAITAAWIVMASQPNVRYLYAAMPLVMVGGAALLGWAQKYRSLYLALVCYLGAATALNAWFLPASSYYHKDFSLRLPFSRAERERYLEQAAPIRKLIGYLNSRHPQSTVLLASTDDNAGLTRTFYANHWHQYSTLDRISRARGAVELFRLLNSWKIDYVIAPKPDPREPLEPASLKRMMELCTIPESQAGDVYLAHLEPDCEQRIANYHPPDKPTITVPPGFWDDFDPAILFRGEWEHSVQFAEPERGSVSYTNVPGSDIMIAFEGTSLRYMYAKAPNRGIVEVIIDGKPFGRFDLYSPAVAWKSFQDFCCFAPGKHLAQLRVTGDHNPNASDSFVDLDGFIVKLSELKTK